MTGAAIIGPTAAATPTAAAMAAGPPAPASPATRPRPPAEAPPRAPAPRRPSRALWALRCCSASRRALRRCFSSALETFADSRAWAFAATAALRSEAASARSAADVLRAAVPCFLTPRVTAPIPANVFPTWGAPPPRGETLRRVRARARTAPPGAAFGLTLRRVRALAAPPILPLALPWARSIPFIAWSRRFRLFSRTRTDADALRAGPETPSVRLIVYATCSAIFDAAQTQGDGPDRHHCISTKQGADER